MLSVAVGQDGAATFTRGITMCADIPAHKVSLFVGTLWGIVITGYVASWISCVGGTAIRTLSNTRRRSWQWLSSSTDAISVTGVAGASRGHAAVVWAVLAEGHVTTNTRICFANTHISADVLLGVAYFGILFSLLATDLGKASRIIILLKVTSVCVGHTVVVAKSSVAAIS